MANIGSFKKSGSEFQGEIVTLSVQTKNVRIVPETNRANDNAPSHRIYVGRAEIGAAWSKRSNEGRDYLSVKLDDPSFNAPIYANLFDDEVLLVVPREDSVGGRHIGDGRVERWRSHASVHPTSAQLAPILFTLN